MRIWAEVWDGGQSEMLGIVNLAGASIVRNLDKAGRMTLDVPATDPNAIKLLRGFRYVYVFTDYPRATARRVGAGVLMQQSVSISGGQKVVTWTCTDGFVDWQRANTLTARIYDDVPIRDVIRDLAELAGWTAKFDRVSGNTSQRFDGVTALEALMTIAKLHGYHFRAAAAQGAGSQDADRQLVFGELGEASDVRLVDAARVGRETRTNRKVALIEQLLVQEDWTQVINAILPFSGPVDGALTLRRATKNTPFPVLTRPGPNGEMLYYLENDIARAEHGTEILAVEGPRELVFPVSSEDTALINAANVLYDWAATQLRRRSGPQRNYSATVAKLDMEPLVGKQVRLTYKGEARTLLRQVRLVNEDADFWVVSQTDRYSLDGLHTDLELSNNSEPARKPEQMIAQILKRSGKLAAQMSVSLKTFKETLTFAGYGDSQTIDFEVSDEAVDVTACRVKLVRAISSPSGPERISLAVDGVDVPGEFMGAVSATSQGQGTVVVDIADTIVSLPVVKGAHVLTVRALYGTGDIEVTISLYEATVGLS